MPGEGELIERIRAAIPSRRAGLRLGIGDDAAVIRPSRGREWVVSCDQFLEGVHFLGHVHSPEIVGYKALARATSDLAAMGATPGYFLLSLALPTARTRGWLERFAGGMSGAAKQFRMVLAGGDTAQNEKVAINITVIGSVERGRAVTRSGAEPGQLIYVSGVLGAAQIGLEIVLQGKHYARSAKAHLQRHFFPAPRLALGQWLAERRLATAMIDLSDGLSTDLFRLCLASGVGAKVWQKQLPALPACSPMEHLRLDPLSLALNGGEDYELLFTVKQRHRKQIPKTFRGLRLSAIGMITEKPGIVLWGMDNKARPLRPHGWDHFKKRKPSYRGIQEHRMAQRE